MWPPLTLSENEKNLNGQRFATAEEIKQETMNEIKAIQESAYFEDRKKCWHKFVVSHGDYF